MPFLTQFCRRCVVCCCQEDVSSASSKAAAASVRQQDGGRALAKDCRQPPELRCDGSIARIHRPSAQQVGAHSARHKKLPRPRRPHACDGRRVLGLPGWRDGPRNGRIAAERRVCALGDQSALLGHLSPVEARLAPTTRQLLAPPHPTPPSGGRRAHDGRLRGQPIHVEGGLTPPQYSTTMCASGLIPVLCGLRTAVPAPAAAHAPRPSTGGYSHGQGACQPALLGRRCASPPPRPPGHSTCECSPARTSHS